MGAPSLASTYLPHVCIAISVILQELQFAITRRIAGTVIKLLRGQSLLNLRPPSARARREFSHETLDLRDVEPNLVKRSSPTHPFRRIRRDSRRTGRASQPAASSARSCLPGANACCTPAAAARPSSSPSPTGVVGVAAPRARSAVLASRQPSGRRPGDARFTSITSRAFLLAASTTQRRPGSHGLSGSDGGVLPSSRRGCFLSGASVTSCPPPQGPAPRYGYGFLIFRWRLPKPPSAVVVRR